MAPERKQRVTLDVSLKLLEEAQQITEKDYKATIIEALEALCRTTYGLACKCARLYRSERLQSHEVGAVLGVSAHYARKLTMLKEKLAPEILVEWKNRDESKRAKYRATTVNALERYASEDSPSLQIAAFKKRVGEAGTPVARMRKPKTRVTVF
jgi:hypothetical protein